MPDRSRHPCPICGDPQAFPLWIDAAPPPTCPHDPAWPERSVVGVCQYQVRKAAQAAELRKLTPDAFDSNGRMLPGQAARALQAWFDANPDQLWIL